MATYTDSLGLELITPGSQAGLWGNTTNNTFNLVDQAITGVTPVSFAAASGTTYTLTNFNGAADEARAAVLNVTGSATGSNTIVVPNKQKTYLVRNSTGQDVVFQTATPNATYTVGAGYSILIFCDGNNNVFTGIASPGVGTLSVNAGGTGTTSFVGGGFVKSSGGTNALTASAKVDAASELSGVTPVANGGTGQSSLPSGSLLIGNGTGNVAVLSGGTIGNIATWNGSTWIASPPATGGVSSVFGRVGAVTAQSSDYSSYYYPLSSNPSGYLTSSALNGYVTTAGNQTISGTKTFSANPIVSGSSTGTNAIAFSNANTYIGSNSAGNIINVTVNGLSSASFLSNAFVATTKGYQPGGGTWADSSDARLKTNVRPLSGALTKIMALAPKVYEWRYDRPGVPNVGFIADDVATVIPTAVTEVEPTKEQKPFIDNGSMVKNIGWQNDMFAYLVGAIQELKAEIDVLKAAK